MTSNNLFDIDIGNQILKKYLKIVLNTYFKGNLRENSAGINFRCNICGDSKKSRTKKRGWIYFRLDPPVFKCWNCGHSSLASQWFKEYFYDVYRDYIAELVRLNRSDLPEPTDEIKIDSVKLKAEWIDPKRYNFYPIESESRGIFAIGQDFCRKRKIPYDVWSKWYISLENSDPEINRYKNRLIIPFWQGQKIFYFQGRTLDGNDAKYINYDTSKEDSIILYGKYDVDYDRPLIVVEGPIDSLFIENCLAGLSTQIGEKTQKFLNEYSCYYLFDYDEDGRKTAKRYIKDGKYVFLWRKFMHDYHLPERPKWDINDIMLFLNRDKKFTFDELQPYFSNNFFSSVLI